MAVGVGIGAGGVVGIAVETTQGTYEAPTKFFPIRSEGLAWQQDTIWRRVIRGTADAIGAVPGNGHVEGSIDMEVLDDVLPYFLQAARGELVQSGTSPDFTYDFTPNSDAEPSDTLSITVVRNGESFGYTGCVVSQMSFSVDNGQLVVDLSILGQEEDTQPVPTETFDDAGPFAAGMWDLQIPSGTTVEDSDDLTLDINDNGEVQNRLLGRRGAAFISYGQREVSLSLERDFKDRTQYNEFKNLTAQQIDIIVDNPDAGTITFSLTNAIINTYEVSLSGQGDLIRASTEYQGTDNAAGDGAYSITIESTEDLALGA